MREEEILNTRFELNVKSMTNFSGLLNIQGTITSVAGGTASEYSSMCPSYNSIVAIYKYQRVGRLSM